MSLDEPPDANLHIALRPGLTLEITEAGALVRSASGKAVARLNPTGALVVELARTDLDLDSMVELLADAYELSAGELRGDIEALVAELADMDILQVHRQAGHDLTIVTGLWDIGRGIEPLIPKEQRREFSSYLDRLAELLTLPLPIVVYIDPEHEEFVWNHRSRLNTKVIPTSVDQLLEGFPCLDALESIRTDPAWTGQAEWLGRSPQAVLPAYAPLVLSKLSMLEEQALGNPFESDHLVWVDAAITNTVPIELISSPRFLAGVTRLLHRFLVAAFPYPDGAEIHGFPRPALEGAAGVPGVQWVARGGFFGGEAEHIITVRKLYDQLMRSTLDAGNLGTEESLLTILAHRHAELFEGVMIGADGLMGRFFEDVARESPRLLPASVERGTRTALYVLSFNHPRQFERTIESWSQQDGFVSDTRNYLIDNSTDQATGAEYQQICREWDFEYLKVDNLGINGGRQFSADHFAATGYEYMIYLEDDMQLKGPDAGLCKVGLPGYVPDLFARVHAIMDAEHFDFLKFSFSEVWGHNGEQWSWYNVSQRVREETWPDFPRLPDEGLADEIPRTRLDTMGVVDGLGYVGGEIYYANWPHIVSQVGNRKMFLDTRWDRPFEQTWMAHMFALTTAGELRPAVLLASPVLHERVDHYEPCLRKES